MVGKSRFGGLFSVLNRKDISTIRLVESHLESQPDFETHLVLADSDTNLEDMSIDEIIEGVEEYIGYLQEYRGVREGTPSLDFQEMRDWQRNLSSEEKVTWAEGQRQSRYWEAQLRPVLKKLKRYETRLQNEALD